MISMPPLAVAMTYLVNGVEVGISSSREKS
jgi:hypothetical protein